MFMPALGSHEYILFGIIGITTLAGITSLIALGVCAIAEKCNEKKSQHFNRARDLKPQELHSQTPGTPQQFSE
jgi:hypothetical protein